jgi:hypothetical protein
MYLFFECVVTKELWKTIATLTGVPEQVNFLSVARLQICKKTHRTPKFLTLYILLHYDYRGNLGMVFVLADLVGLACMYFYGK